jgi:hypothetical protein
MIYLIFADPCPKHDDILHLASNININQSNPLNNEFNLTEETDNYLDGMDAQFRQSDPGGEKSQESFESEDLQVKNYLSVIT